MQGLSQVLKLGAIQVLGQGRAEGSERGTKRRGFGVCMETGEGRPLQPGVRLPLRPVPFKLVCSICRVLAD